MKNISIWSDIKNKKSYPKLDKNLKVDVLIVGGGITGLSAAYHLRNSNLNVCLVEKKKIASGVTSKTTGKLTYLQENIYSTLKKYFNEKIARKYLNSQKYAIDLVKNIIKDNNINCNFNKSTSYLFEDTKINSFNKEYEILSKFLINYENTNILPNNKIVNKGIKVYDTYVFHPLKYLYSLAEIISNKINIYEDTKIISLEKENDGYVCKTPDNIIRAKKVIFALHYPYFLIPYLMPLKCYLEKSYIGATRVKKDYLFNAINISKPTISIRYHNDKFSNYEIYLTNSHNTCVNDNYERNFKPILDRNPEYIWSNKDIITYDRLPFIGSLNDDNSLLIGTGYNTWGMTNGSIAGKILADIVLEKGNEYIDLFNPKRCLNLGKIINFPIILGSNTYSFIKSKIKKNKNWYPSNVRYEKKNGKDIAIYTDDLGEEHIVYNLCPHLKCGLLFNPIEKTWDCPCHGSRFDLDGNSIEGPSNYNIIYKG